MSKPLNFGGKQQMSRPELSPAEFPRVSVSSRRPSFDRDRENKSPSAVSPGEGEERQDTQHTHNREDNHELEDEQNDEPEHEEECTKEQAQQTSPSVSHSGDHDPPAPVPFLTVTEPSSPVNASQASSELLAPPPVVPGMQTSTRSPSPPVVSGIQTSTRSSSPPLIVSGIQSSTRSPSPPPVVNLSQASTRSLYPPPPVVRGMQTSARSLPPPPVVNVSQASTEASPPPAKALYTSAQMPFIRRSAYEDLCAAVAKGIWEYFHGEGCGVNQRWSQGEGHGRVQHVHRNEHIGQEQQYFRGEEHGRGQHVHHSEQLGQENLHSSSEQHGQDQHYSNGEGYGRGLYVHRNEQNGQEQHVHDCCYYHRHCGIEQRESHGHHGPEGGIMAFSPAPEAENATHSPHNHNPPLRHRGAHTSGHSAAASRQNLVNTPRLPHSRAESPHRHSDDNEHRVYTLLPFPGAIIPQRHDGAHTSGPSAATSRYSLANTPRLPHSRAESPHSHAREHLHACHSPSASVRSRCSSPHPAPNADPDAFRIPQLKRADAYLWPPFLSFPRFLYCCFLEHCSRNPYRLHPLVYIALVILLVWCIAAKLLLVTIQLHELMHVPWKKWDWAAESKARRMTDGAATVMPYVVQLVTFFFPPVPK